MSVESWSTIVGTGGALWTTLSFLPQLISVRRHGGRDLSLTMLAMYLVGSLLWLVYGVLRVADSPTPRHRQVLNAPDLTA